jgi:hypothetical protein
LGPENRPVTAREVSLGVTCQVGAFVIALMSGGCAYSYVDSSNVRHVIWLVDVSISPAEPNPSGPQSSAVSVTSVGLHVYSGTANGGGIVLGYGKETVVSLPNNACIDLNAPGVCASAALSPSTDTNARMKQP